MLTLLFLLRVHCQHPPRTPGRVSGKPEAGQSILPALRRGVHARTRDAPSGPRPHACAHRPRVVSLWRTLSPAVGGWGRGLSAPSLQRSWVREAIRTARVQTSTTVFPNPVSGTEDGRRGHPSSCAIPNPRILKPPNVRGLCRFPQREMLGNACSGFHVDPPPNRDRGILIG